MKNSKDKPKKKIKKGEKKKFGGIKKVIPKAMDFNEHYAVYAMCNTLSGSNPYTTCYEICGGSSSLC
jgi:hypothetical protein